MNVLHFICLATGVLLAAVIYRQYQQLAAPLAVPNIEFYEYWGPGDGQNYKESDKIEPFQISYDEHVIKRLRSKLEDVPHLAEPLEGVAFEYGFNSVHLKEILEYWRTSYLDRWDQREKFLNQYPQFKTQIQGLDIHFLHVRPPKVNNPKRRVPLLMLHGWPGSVREFYEIIPKLTTRSDEYEYVFELVIPSLPGYGFSQAAARPGLSAAKIAVIMHNLMSKLGFHEYYVHAGDWGAVIGSLMGAFFPKNVLGVHLTMCVNLSPLASMKNIIGGFIPNCVVENEAHIPYYFPQMDKFKTLLAETGYMHLQSTKPDTIGIALTGNPIGLAAYILEKFSVWTNPSYLSLADGGLYKYFDRDALLDNVMIYYLTDSITTSQRLYKEYFSGEAIKNQYDRVPIKVPAACAKFRYELMHQTDWALRDRFQNLVQSNHFDDGGHFAALQLPDVLYRDIFEFVNRFYKRGF
ncbi:juvenile hormone epoxide hydrolase 1-like [Uranotaenia lowii]|uniref:juvenile hormone epoxide hydrolase 1-like n=1 Tax=Uranotaenia lowii TaxID=190385 RepID=UPI00247B0F02|nr:juvenile hormone epoxide hydrolase 1-like [Uranotaenia lowii]